MKNFKIVAFGLIILLSITALTVYRLKQRNDSQLALKKSKTQIVPVTIIHPKIAKFSATLTVSGSFLPVEEIQVIPKGTGKIKYLKVEEGDYIKKGELIAEIEHSEIDAQLDQAKAQEKVAKASLKLALNGALNPQFEQSKALIKQYKANIAQLVASKNNLEVDFNNYSSLEKKGIISNQQVNSALTQIKVLQEQINASKQQLVSAEQSLQLLKDGTRPEQIEINKAQVENASATVNLFKAQLENYRIISPVDGVVSKKFLYQGSLVTQTTPILTLSKKSDPDLVLNIPEKEVYRLKTKQQVVIKDPENNDKKITGYLKSINPSVDPITHLIKARATTKESNKFKLGTILDCLIITNEKSNALIVPSDSVIRTTNKNIVYVAKDKKAILKEVEIGMQNTESIEILSGLEETDSVILKGNAFVNSGDEVNIQSESN